MSDTNQITVRGRVGTEPDITITPSGRQVTKFRLGSTRGYRDTAGEWRDHPTEWFTVKVWGGASDAVSQSLHRGMPVVVQGVLSTEEWISGDDRNQHTNVITATTVAVEVRYGLVTFNKVTRIGPPEAVPAVVDGPPAEEPPGLEDPEEEGASPEEAAELAVERDEWARAEV
ncbi:single-stranded DNA-binding protein [Georgenia sp. 311]|uniref:single-stranded DNA-binding protein n=1 Tax=Georgenia sp. 311 TaxID=2585134 RepID=UPI001111DF5C|nr:single-stranded DNA-binding protein [Georgenia sp. 311]TNC17651.1 single-stranded DNA-binding protein [Georgenia sp. 311]